LSWAATQVPEITAAAQSFLNVGFCSAAQAEFFVIDEVSISYKGGAVSKFQEFCPRLEMV
jgi:hypothetical protein